MNYVIVIVEKRNQEIQETMLKARDSKYSVPVRYGKVLFCGAAAAGKSNFLNLLMKEDFPPLHISNEVLKPQQVTIAMKAMVTSNNDEVEFKRMEIDDEIFQLESYLPKKYNIPIAPLQKIPLQAPSWLTPSADSFPKKYISSTVTPQTPLQYHEDKPPADNIKLALANVRKDTKKLNEKLPGAVWNILTFMDTGGQPQFISMLPAVNSFAMITFIVHKMGVGGQISLKDTVKVQYGNMKGEVLYTPHPHKYTYLELIETLISYSSNIIHPDATFLDRVKTESKEYENTRSILLTRTHSGDDQLSEDDIKEVDEELTKVVNKSGVNHIKPRLNKIITFWYQWTIKYKVKILKYKKLKKIQKDTQILLTFAGIYKNALIVKMKFMFLLNGYYSNLKYEKFVNK